MAERLLDFKLTQVQIGLFFMLATAAYVPGCLTASIIPKRIERRVVLILANFSVFVAFLFVGPSILFNFNDSLVLMIIGQVLMGFLIAY